MDVSQFAADLRARVEDAKQALREAERDEDYFAVDVRTGELKSLLRMAGDNDVAVDLGEWADRLDNGGTAGA
jgi:hypothetical protein